MSTQPHNTRPTPERIFSTLIAFRDADALRTAIELDLFTAIGEGTDQATALAKKTGAAERGVRILCDFLTINGFLAKKDSRYALTAESAAFLDRRSPACMAGLAGFLGTKEMRDKSERLIDAVRKGGCAQTGGDNSQPNDERWVAFARSMAPMMIPAAQFIAGLLRASEGAPMKVLDIAAGHGVFGITIAQQNPQARVVALDWAPVLAVAGENARAAGLNGRYEARPGSAFDTEFGEGYDAVLLTNFLHHFDPATCEKLLGRVHAALQPGGRAVLLEFVPNEDRVSPAMPAGFSLTMLTTTDAGDAYTFSEFERMLRNAGFAHSTLHPVPGPPQCVIVAEKA